MKKLTAVLVVFLTLLLMAQPVSANSPPPDDTYIFYFESLPPGTVYVDLLIKLPTDDSKYTPLEEKNLPEGIAETAPIVTYCQEDFRSYSLHYEGAISAIRVSEESTVSFFARNTYGQMEDVMERGQVKLAMIDEVGNILQVSRSIALDSNSIFKSVIHEVHYNAETDWGQVRTEVSQFAVVVFVIFSLVGMAFTCVLEWGAAWPFGLDKKYSKLIFLTNVVSQAVMRLLDAVIQGLVRFDYIYMVLLLEILVYVGEFLFYRKKMMDVSWKRCLLYTVIANSLSLILGLYVFRFALI